MSISEQTAFAWKPRSMLSAAGLLLMIVACGSSPPGHLQVQAGALRIDAAAGGYCVRRRVARATVSTWQLRQATPLSP